MFRIGDFSRLTQVSVKTLRFYDQEGLLEPARVDEVTGYRYYSADQMPALNRILALKDLGFSLDHIHRMINEQLPSEQIRGMLRLRQAEAQQRLSEERDRLLRIEARIRQIEQEDKMSNYDVVTKSIDPVRIASIRRIIPNYPSVGQLFGELCGNLVQDGVKLDAPGIAVYYDPEYKEKDVDVEVGMPVNGSFAGNEAVGIHELPAIATAACLIHHGPYTQLFEAYAELMKWVQQNGYRICGPCREVYLRCVDSGAKDESDCVTEIQCPVEKIA